jgi:hypothetical protein
MVPAGAPNRAGGGGSVRPSWGCRAFWPAWRRSSRRGSGR